MPRLPAQMQGAAKDAFESGGSFAPFPPGVYTGRLSKVEAKEASTGNPMWVWEFDELQDLDGKKMPGRQWVNTVLTDAAMWKVGEAFAAFGVGTDTDTDTLVGKRCRLVISKRVITGGARAGQEGNNVDRLEPLAGTEAAVGAGVGAGVAAGAAKDTAEGDKTLDF